MRKLLFILIFIPLLSFSQDDRTKHMIAGNVISLGVGAITYELTDKPFLSLAVGFSSGVLVGVLKEVVWDRAMQKGTYNKTDMMDTAWGSTIGTLMVTVYIDINRKKRETIKDF